MIIDRETDGKLRAFMFVENCHLDRYWRYKAIKEEISILHQKLVRINKFMNQFVFEGSRPLPFTALSPAKFQDEIKEDEEQALIEVEEKEDKDKQKFSDEFLTFVED